MMLMDNEVTKALLDALKEIGIKVTIKDMTEDCKQECYCESDCHGNQNICCGECERCDDEDCKEFMDKADPKKSFEKFVREIRTNAEKMAEATVALTNYFNEAIGKVPELVNVYNTLLKLVISETEQNYYLQVVKK